MSANSLKDLFALVMPARGRNITHAGRVDGVFPLGYKVPTFAN